MLRRGNFSLAMSSLEAIGPINDEMVTMIKETPKVTGFVGGGDSADSP